MSEVDTFIEQLICYRKGEGTIDEVEAVFSKLNRFKNFHQFISDGAIRAENINFSIMQEKALAQFLKLLRDNNFEEAEQITFLSKE